MTRVTDIQSNIYPISEGTDYTFENVEVSLQVRWHSSAKEVSWRTLVAREGNLSLVVLQVVEPSPVN